MSIKLDQFAHLREENGIKATEDLLHTVAQFVDKNTADQHTLSRFQEDSFIMLLPNTDADSGLRLAENLCGQIAGEIIEVGQQTFAATLSIGLTVISETVTTVESAIGRCSEAIEKLRSEQSGVEVGNGARLYELEFSPLLTKSAPITRLRSAACWVTTSLNCCSSPLSPCTAKRHRCTKC